MNHFDIIYQNEDLVAINKPAGIMVHRTGMTEDKIFILQLLRNQLKRRIYPIHRLDRATSGVLIFGLTPQAAGRIQKAMQEQKVSKQYIAIVRGWILEQGLVDYPIRSGRNFTLQDAQTSFSRISLTEAPLAISRYPNSRYSLVSVMPKTGKYHQIRRHFAHLRHPIIGDKKHGDCKHNAYFERVKGIKGMMLHAHTFSIQLEHEQVITIVAPLPKRFYDLAQLINLDVSPYQGNVTEEGLV